MAETKVKGKIPAEYHDEISQCAQRYNGTLYRFLFRLTQGDHALAEDLVQQVLIEAAQDWAKVRGLDDVELRNRLYQMATWRAIDAFRKNSTARAGQSWMLANFRQPETDPHAYAITTAVIERFVKVIETLPPRQALAASLHWRCGWKNREIADALEITCSAVSQLLGKAEATLRRELRPYLPFEPCDPEGGACS
jgi:RNA polymerase sigma factor (sigma-70 family)